MQRKYVLGRRGEKGDEERSRKKYEKFGMMVYVSFTDVRIQGDCHYDQYC